jgi:hypothetical protein
MSSTLRLDSHDVDIEQYAVLATVTHARASRWSFSASLGSIVGGALTTGGATYDVAPGVVGSLAATRAWDRGPWFVAGTFSAAVSRARAGDEGLTAGDGRLGVVAGRRVGPVGPYALARAFGGPVMWRLDGADVSGGDAHHYQLGAGASYATGRVSLVLDLAVLGERGASLGVAVEL